MLYESTIFSLNESQYAINKILSNFTDSIFQNEELAFKLKIILNELVNNCFIHSESGSYVRILAKCKENCICFALIDDSEGFDYSKLDKADFSSEDIQLKECGRGIHIVRKLSDTLKYNRRGNVIAIKVNLV